MSTLSLRREIILLWSTMSKAAVESRSRRTKLPESAKKSSDGPLLLFSDSDVVSFDGSSSLLYSLGPRLRQMTSECISLKFKTLRDSGILIQMQGHSDNSLTLELQKGKLLILLGKGATLNLLVHTL